MQPLVSILIPAYNASVWITESIQSALEQTWPRKEVIVVDDGSTDGTLAVARRFGSKTVKVVSQPNQGAAAARNRAFSMAQGDFVQWLDADDLLAPDKVARQLAAWEKLGDRRILLSSAYGSFFFRRSKAKFAPSRLWCDLSPVDWLATKLEDGCWMQTATWLVSRELSEDAGPWDGRMMQDDDGEYFCRVILGCHGIRFVREAKVYYRLVGAAGLHHIGLSNRRLEAQLLSEQLHINYLRSMADDERVRHACLTALQRRVDLFYPERPDLVATLESIAGELGENLAPPRLRWKFAWMKPLIGWKRAKHTQLILPQFKQSMLRTWDRAMWRTRARPAVADGERFVRRRRE